MWHWSLILAGLILLLLTLPGTVELTLLTIAGMLPATRPKGNRREAEPIRKLAIVIPAHNEALGIARTIKSVGACNLPPTTRAVTVVIADNCSDDTAELARAGGVRVIERTDPERRGKGFALEYAFAKLLAEGFDAVFVMDADTLVDSNTLTEVIERLAAGADGVQTRYLVLNPDASMRTRLMNIAFMAFNLLRPRGRERLGLSVGIFGNGFALSRSTLEAVPYDAHSVVEDLEYHLRLVRAGRCMVFAERGAVRGEMPVKAAASRSQRARWEGGRFRAIIESVPDLVRGIRAGNRLLLEPLLELLLLPLSLHVALVAAILAAPCRPQRLYACGALMLVAVHVCSGIVVGGGGRRDFFALLTAPLYVVWKLTVTTAILKAASRAAPWIRTARE